MANERFNINDGCEILLLEKAKFVWDVMCEKEYKRGYHGAENEIYAARFLESGFYSGSETRHSWYLVLSFSDTDRSHISAISLRLYPHCMDTVYSTFLLILEHSEGTQRIRGSFLFSEVNFSTPEYNLEEPICFDSTSKLEIHASIRAQVIDGLITIKSLLRSLNLTDDKYRRDFRHLLESGDFSDVILSVEGVEIRCHKYILACRSTYFQNVVQDCGEAIRLSGFTANAVKKLITYLYTEECPELSPSSAVELRKAACFYQVSDLVEKCQKIIKWHAGPFAAYGKMPENPLLPIADGHYDEVMMMKKSLLTWNVSEKQLSLAIRRQETLWSDKLEANRRYWRLKLKIFRSKFCFLSLMLCSPSEKSVYTEYEYSSSNRIRTETWSSFVGKFLFSKQNCCSQDCKFHELNSTDELGFTITVTLKTEVSGNLVSLGNAVSSPEFLRAATTRYQNDFEYLLHTGYQHDFAIRVGCVDIPCHRSVLSCRSSYFEDVLKSDYVGDHLELTGFQVNVIGEMVHFMYTSKCPKFILDFALELLRASHVFSLPDLKELCCFYLGQTVDSTNASDVFLSADFCCAPNLKRKAEVFVQNQLSNLKCDVITYV